MTLVGRGHRVDPYTEIHELKCANGHQLRAEILDGSILAVATVSPYTETWEFVDASFCPTCGGEIVT